MPVNQPPIADDLVLSSWQYEMTRFINELEQIIQRSRSTRGPEFVPDPEQGSEHYLTVDVDTFLIGWYKFDQEAGWLRIQS